MAFLYLKLWRVRVIWKRLTWMGTFVENQVCTRGGPPNSSPKAGPNRVVSFQDYSNQFPWEEWQLWSADSITSHPYWAPSLFQTLSSPGLPLIFRNFPNLQLAMLNQEEVEPHPTAERYQTTFFQYQDGERNHHLYISRRLFNLRQPVLPNLLWSTVLTKIEIPYKPLGGFTLPEQRVRRHDSVQMLTILIKPGRLHPL